MDKIQSKNIVTKSNDLIMSRYDLSLAEQRLIIEVASMISPDDEDFKDYVVSVRDYVDLVDSTAKNEYQRMKDLAEKMLKKPLFLHQPDGGWVGMNWFSSFAYKPRIAVLECSFDPHLKPYLLKLKNCFTSYQLKNVLKLKSKYAVRLYEILKSKAKLKTWEIELDELRKMIVIPENYTWQDIKRRVLESAKKSLKATDIQFKFEPIKRGRRIHAVKFSITDTGQIPLELEPAAPKSDSDTANEKNPAENLLNLIPPNEQKRAEKLMQQALEKYPATYIKEKILLANSQKELGNYSAWLRSALKNDYQPPARKPKKAAPPKSKKIDTEAKRIDAEMERAREIRRRFAALPAAERQARKQKILDENPEMIAAQAVQIAAEEWAAENHFNGARIFNPG